MRVELQQLEKEELYRVRKKSRPTLGTRKGQQSAKRQETVPDMGSFLDLGGE